MSVVPKGCQARARPVAYLGRSRWAPSISHVGYYGPWLWCLRASLLVLGSRGGCCAKRLDVHCGYCPALAVSFRWTVLPCQPQHPASKLRGVLTDLVGRVGPAAYFSRSTAAAALWDGRHSHACARRRQALGSGATQPSKSRLSLQRVTRRGHLHRTLNSCRAR